MNACQNEKVSVLRERQIVRGALNLWRRREPANHPEWNRPCPRFLPDGVARIMPRKTPDCQRRGFPGIIRRLFGDAERILTPFADRGRCPYTFRHSTPRRRLQRSK